MIVTRDGSRWRLVTQADHARLAAEILALWRRDGLPEHPRRETLLHAVREHDCGWWEADAAPRVLDGRPMDFREVDPALRDEIWLRAWRRLEGGAHAVLLLLEHAAALHPEGGPRAHLDELAGDRAALLEEAGLDEAEVASDYRWLAVADAVSLCVCGAWERLDRAGYRCSTTSSGRALEPFPLAGATTFRVPCRHVPVRDYASDGDLAGELATARWERLAVGLGPPPAAPGGLGARDTLAT